MPIAVLVFCVLFGRRLGLFEGSLSAIVVVSGGVWTQLLWGFYQEVVYRGILQTELMRRFGTLAGVLLANFAFTFGPLHFLFWDFVRRSLGRPAFDELVKELTSRESLSKAAFYGCSA